MLNEKQINAVEASFKPSDNFVFTIGSRTWVSFGGCKKKRKGEGGVVEFKECYEVDETCFDGTDYYGDTTGEGYNIILEDENYEYPNAYISRYRDDELISSSLCK